MNQIDQYAKTDTIAVIDLLEEVLAQLQSARPRRRRAIQHVEAAIKCLKDPREHLHPSELNSANDG